MGSAAVALRLPGAEPATRRPSTPTIVPAAASTRLGGRTSGRASVPSRACDPVGRVFISSGLLAGQRPMPVLNLQDPAGLFGGTPRRFQSSGVPVVHDLSAVALLLVPPLAWPQNGVVMSMQPRPWPDVPELTARMARSSSRQGNLAMRIRDELGEVYADARFAGAFGCGAGFRRHRPSPSYRENPAERYSTPPGRHERRLHRSRHDQASSSTSFVRLHGRRRTIQLGRQPSFAEYVPN